VRFSRIRLSDWLHEEACEICRGVDRSSRRNMRRDLLASTQSFYRGFRGSTTGVTRPKANLQPLPQFRSAPEAGPLPSTGITRPQRYYGPLRLPHRPPPRERLKDATPPPARVSRVATHSFSTCHPHYPGESLGIWTVTSSENGSLPRKRGGSALATVLSRPAQGSHSLRPMDLLALPRRTFVRAA
jgi:hypothetical protein